MEQGRYIGNTNYLRKELLKKYVMVKIGFKYLCLDKIILS